MGWVTSPADSGKLRLEYGYGVPAGCAIDATKNNGNVRSQTITVPGVTHPPVQTYEYDEVNRLKFVEEAASPAPSWKQVYSYDPFGNRALVGGAGATTYPVALDASNNLAAGDSNNRIK